MCGNLLHFRFAVYRGKAFVSTTVHIHIVEVVAENVQLSGMNRLLRGARTRAFPGVRRAAFQKAVPFEICIGIINRFEPRNLTECFRKPIQPRHMVVKREAENFRLTGHPHRQNRRFRRLKFAEIGFRLRLKRNVISVIGDQTPDRIQRIKRAGCVICREERAHRVGCIGCNRKCLDRFVRRHIPEQRSVQADGRR